MRQAAIPALLKVIRTTPGGSVEATNAMYAIMTIHQHPGKGIALLRKTADSEQDGLAAVHLREAAKEAESIWCKDPGQCAEQ